MKKDNSPKRLTTMSKILLNSFNQGGVADSLYSGVKNSLARIVGFNLHGTPGVLTANQKMTKHSGTTITEFSKVAVDLSNGIHVWFSSSSGKIWTENAGTYNLVYTSAPLSGSAACLGAYEYQGTLYWATQQFIYKIPVSSTTGATWTVSNPFLFLETNTYLLNSQISNTTTTGNNYNLPTSVSEAAANKRAITGTGVAIKGIRVFPAAKGTGNWTLTVHDVTNTLIASKTINNADLVNDLSNHFEFSSPITLTNGGSYHFHLHSSVSDGYVSTGAGANIADVVFDAYAAGSSSYHPMREVNLVLYIGDGNYVHQIDTGVFSQFALDLAAIYTVSALGEFGTDLLVGTIISSTTSRCKIFRWNTYGVSFINDDTIPEPGINAFLEVDNHVIFNAGNAGNLYSYDGQFASFYKKVPGTYSPTKQAKVHPNAVGLLNGTLPIFGVSNVQGNPCDQGIWSLGRHSPEYPVVRNLEFPTSNVDGSGYNILTGIEIGAILVSGQDVYASWSYNSTYGVDKLDYSNKIAKPFLETRLMSPEVAGFTTFDRFIATTEPLPANTSIVFKLNKDGAGFGSALSDVIADAQRHQTATEKERVECRTLQLRVEAVSSGNNSPIIQEIVIPVT